MQATINIPQPCSENWDAMQPDANGRHCSLCVHTVIDFTTWELQDIAAYLKKHTEKRICGRFLNSQLNQPFDLTVLAPKVISWNTDGWRKVAALIIICFALTSCMGKANNNNRDTEQALQVMGEAMNTPIQDSIEEKPKAQTAPMPMLKEKANKNLEEPVGYAELYEGHTMGLPALEEPLYEIPKDSIKHQLLIGPPEDTLSEIK
jgi:hypothetical protein